MKKNLIIFSLIIFGTISVITLGYLTFYVIGKFQTETTQNESVKEEGPVSNDMQVIRVATFIRGLRLHTDELILKHDDFNIENPNSKHNEELRKEKIKNKIQRIAEGEELILKIKKVEMNPNLPKEIQDELENIRSLYIKGSKSHIESLKVAKEGFLGKDVDENVQKIEALTKESIEYFNEADAKTLALYEQLGLEIPENIK